MEDAACQQGPKIQIQADLVLDGVQCAVGFKGSGLVEKVQL
jgi:hypothetical protein